MRRFSYFALFYPILLLCLSLIAQDSGSSPVKPPAAQRNTEAAKAVEAQGQELLFQKHDLKGAIESFKKTVKLDPWYAHGYMMLGLAYMQAERWDEAHWAFEDASKVEPENAQAWLGVGSALNEQKDYAGAQKALQKSLELKPGSAEAHYEMGRSLWGLEKLEAAAEQTKRAIELNKDYVSPHVLMGNIYLSGSDPESALAEFREALKLDPEGPQASSIKQTISDIEKANKKQ
ncbi:MAG TPA: tetratricopeptide repeat protein [Candidatus Angelobacter sp.]